MSRGSGDDALRSETQKLAKAIADYKQMAKSVKGLENQNKPKCASKAKAKAKAKAAA